MMGSRPARRPDDFVIWGSTSMLGVLTGLGAAFVVWSQFQSTETAYVPLALAILALGIGVGLIGTAVTNGLGRLFVWCAAAAFLTGFFLGAPVFQTLLFGG